MHLLHLVCKRPCLLQKNTAVHVSREGLKTNKQKHKKIGKAGNFYTVTQEIKNKIDEIY